LECLRDEDPNVREAAAEVLGRMGEAAATPEVLQALAKCLRDENWGVREAAAEALRQMGKAAATPGGITTGLGWWWGHCWEGALVEMAIGEAVTTPEVIQALLKRLRGKDKVMRMVAARVLKEIGEAAATPEVLRALAKCLRDKDRDVREAAAEALKEMGEAAATPEVLQALAKCLRDENWGVREAAAEAFTAWHRQGLRFFRDAQGRWTVRTVEELSALLKR
jgi:HEAT repeat protein